MVKLKINIPFDGFYNSYLDSQIDREIEQYIEDYNNGETGEHAPDIAITYNELQINYSAMRLEIAKAYVSDFQQYLADELEINISLEFELLDSPREYNFATDRIFCLISEADIAKLYNETQKLTLINTIKERHSSYDGFHSFYTTDFEEWKEQPVKEWDCNMLETLLISAILTVTGDEYIYPVISTHTLAEWSHSMRENIGNLVDECITIKGERT